MLRRYIHNWQSRRETAATEALALRLGPHIALDIGLDYPHRRAVPVCLNPVR